MTIQVECDELQSQALSMYAQHKGVSVSNLLLEASLEELEDEYDSSILAGDEEKNLPNISHEELGKILGLK